MDLQAVEALDADLAEFTGDIFKYLAYKGQRGYGQQYLRGLMEVLPAVFHALWHGQLTASLDTPLHERVPVGPRSWSGSQTGDAG